MKKIDKLIINSPYEEPQQHWEYLRDTREFVKRSGRRPAGYVIASESSRAFDDPGIFIEIELVNTIRPRIKKWREQGFPGVTGITKRLLQHWQDDQEERKDKRFFFCQLEAIETLIWLTEAPEADRTGIAVPGDGGNFSRWCSKMATGSGKTIVMGMLIAWQTLNKITNGKDTRFSKNVLVVAPGLTVRNRLSVLNPFNGDNYYEEFNIVPSGLMESLRQSKVKIINWHTLAWDSEEKLGKKKSVDKRGAKSDEAYVREVLDGMASATNLIVINDEAHHAWRVPAESKIKGVKKEDIEESTVWIGGLDRINRARGIIRCFDLSATPFAPSGKKATEEALFSWIVSDFGLNDAIESGLVKTPRVVIRDDGYVDNNLRSRLYHIYMDATVKDDINRKVEESDPLPDLIKNAYLLLGKDWKATKDDWEKAGYRIPPVMITVANTTFTSGRLKFSFDHDSFLFSVTGLDDLCNPEKTLQIDTSILDKAEAAMDQVEFDSEESDDTDNDLPKERKLTKKQQAELLRLTVDTVGKVGQPGEQIQNVISVGMLSEGWDAKTVTHIMGLRAFSSQLLCEQVVGRGLRRTSYDIGGDGLFEPEYVNIFGVPFTFLPHEGGTDGPPPPPPTPKTKIEPCKEKAEHEITFPNILRIDHIYKPQLSLDLAKVKPLELDPYQSITEAELAAIIAGKPNPAALTEIDLKEIGEKFRLQSIVFRIASTIYNSEKRPAWKGSKETFLIQLIGIVEQFIYSDKIEIKNPLFNQDEARKRILIMLNMNKIIQHIWNEIRAENTTQLTPVFDKEHPIRSTADVRTWWTSKPCENFGKSHINFTVIDINSKWEYLGANTINSVVKSFVKNDHLGFVVYYNYRGVIRSYFPDFIIKLTSGDNFVLEIKGQDDEQNRTKRVFLDEWCRAVNQHGGFGKWKWAVSFDPNDVDTILSALNCN
ncbi:MAG: DEAD/DEAH box helicase family protein [Nitrospirae bacterium]|nr:DEAD/DEAH box helicase family protein [Nitrospirota bacterium]